MQIIRTLQSIDRSLDLFIAKENSDNFSIFSFQWFKTSMIKHKQRSQWETRIMWVPTDPSWNTSCFIGNTFNTMNDILIMNNINFINCGHFDEIELVMVLGGFK